MIESLRHVQVVGALARLAGNRGWARILAGGRLYGELDVADARLLVAAGVLRRRDAERWEPVDLHPWYDDPVLLASSLQAELQRAIRHGLDRPAAADAWDVEAMGRASRAVAAVLADAVLPTLPVTRERLAAGTARLLDVGVGTGALTASLCRAFPGLRAVGLDVSADVLALAAERLAGSSLAERIDLRLQSVVDLGDVEVYDLAWLPQVFVRRDELGPGLARVHAALRPGCWLVMPVAASGPDSAELERAAVEHDAVRRGGGPMPLDEVTGLLAGIGFGELRDLPGVSQTLVMARKP